MIEMALLIQGYLGLRKVRPEKKREARIKLRLECPQCGRSLKGVTEEMIGDIGVCAKCKAEFVIEQKE